MSQSKSRFAAFDLLSHNLLDKGSWLSTLEKAIPLSQRQPSNQGALIGRMEALLDHDAVAVLKDHNVHHSAALEAKGNAAIGLGHRNDSVAKALNEMTTISWQETLDAAVADYFEYANGYLEVVRNSEGEIRGIHHLPAKDVLFHIEEHSDIFHYEIRDKGDFALTSTLNGTRFARFGEKKDFMKRRKIEAKKAGHISEVIHFPLNRGRRSRYYGYPDWIAAVPPMELDHCVTQYSFDFFLNGGVPEAIYTVVGGKMGSEDWSDLQKAFQAHVGLGNRRKVMLLNIGDLDTTVQLDKLTLDGQTAGDNQVMVDAQALKILSAHRTPPILAGVTPPGKMGANNEMTNALMMFQLLVIGPAQKQFSQILACTLGNELLNGGIPLKEDDFLGVGSGDKEPDPNNMSDPLAMRDVDHGGNGFNTILDEIDLGKAETVSKMRMSMAEADFKDRDLTQGTAERGSDVKAKRGDRS